MGRPLLAVPCLLYAVSGSNKYVRIVMEQKVWWEGASDAEKKIYDEFIMTRRLESGKRIYADRSVEWVVKEIRHYLGKYTSRFMMQQLTRTVLSLDDRAKVRKDLQDDPGPYEPTTDETELSIVYCLSRVWSDESNLWGRGSVNVGKLFKKKAAESEFSTADGLDLIHPDARFLITTAEERLTKYFSEYYVDGALNQVKRPHSQVDLRYVPALQKGFGKQQKAIEDWNKSTNATRLAEVAIKDDLVANLEYVNSLLASDSKVEGPKYGKKKKAHAEALKERGIARPPRVRIVSLFWKIRHAKQKASRR